MRWLIILALSVAPAFAQDELKDARERFDLVATRATAYLHSADSIEARLNEDGATLHPQLIALRLRIVASLNEARRAIDKGEVKGANRAMGTAEVLVDRFAKKIGGE